MGIAMWLKQACEFLGGERDEGPPGFPIGLRSPLWGLWWGILGCAILMFCGQSSKFIYIDF
jgi:hypothetical protein